MSLQKIYVNEMFHFVSGGGSSSGSVVKPVKFDVSKVRIWNHDDVELPRFDEITHAEIGKWAIFKV